MTTSKEPKSKKNNSQEAALKKQISELGDAQKRLAAELANVQRRAEEEKQALVSRARTNILEELFPVLDNLYRASSHAPTLPVDNNFSALSQDDFKRIRTYFDGLRMIEKQLEDVLGTAGLSRIKTIGEVFNHNLHEAISYEQNPNIPADHIIAEIESGWQIDGKVIRPAKVRVSQG